MNNKDGLDGPKRRAQQQQQRRREQREVKEERKQGSLKEECPNLGENPVERPTERKEKAVGREKQNAVKDVNKLYK